MFGKFIAAAAGVAAGYALAKYVESQKEDECCDCCESHDCEDCEMAAVCGCSEFGDCNEGEYDEDTPIVDGIGVDAANDDDTIEDDGIYGEDC